MRPVQVCQLPDQVLLREGTVADLRRRPERWRTVRPRQHHMPRGLVCLQVPRAAARVSEHRVRVFLHLPDLYQSACRLHPMRLPAGGVHHQPVGVFAGRQRPQEGLRRASIAAHGSDPHFLGQRRQPRHRVHRLRYHLGGHSHPRVRRLAAAQVPASSDRVLITREEIPRNFDCYFGQGLCPELHLDHMEHVPQLLHHVPHCCHVVSN
mmetsp:Transcript_30348/g.61102  ORF Transcript_30348/g.61102 Transcript_30348/m.61102 type:complete len:208 (+) Transcript_30348:208-831(+)